MNRHFRDARYYLKRAAQTATKGLKAELAPVEERIRELTGRETEPEPGRLGEVKADLKEVQVKAEGEAREAIAEAKETVEEYRNKRTA